MLVLPPFTSVLTAQKALSQPERAAAATRLIRFGTGANDTTRVQAASLDAFILGSTSLTSLDVGAAFASAIAARRAPGPGFMDLTDAGSTVAALLVSSAPFPTPNATNYPEVLEDMFPLVSAKGLEWTIGNLTENFNSRFYRSPKAREPALWLADQFADAVGNDSVVLVENTFDQPNVIASIPRAENSTNDEVIVLGAHFDSVNGYNPLPSARAPGADDDASGTAVILQTLRILAATGFRGARRIEAHAYAGEEGGLLGSVRTAAQYAKNGTAVRAMLQFEMIGYQPSSKPVISLTTDTAPDLQAFVSALVKAYIPSSEATFRTTACGYGCSDHDSWVHNGYSGVALAAAGPRDRELNPYYHSAQDTLDKLDMGKASVFVKAALAFAVELSGRA